MSKFSPGDPALLIQSRFPENVGRQVVILAYEGTTEDGVPLWNVRSVNGPLRAAFRLTGKEVYNDEAIALETSLMPLRGDDGGDEVLEEDRPLEVVA